MDKILEVNNLKVSFRTSSGTVKAVRDISFDLERGKTLAIVGESGSGKSVTSKAVLGILAGNSIVEGGEIIYDGKDLLKISEEEMCTIRGDKISMIFQDPLSALNPIVKIGKQITEAMLLKNKTSRKEARKDFNDLLAILDKHMAAAIGDSAKAKAMTKTFDKFCIEANRLENNYNNSLSTAEALVDAIEDFLFRMSKNQKLDVKATLREYRSRLKKINDSFFVAHFSGELDALSDKLGSVSGDYHKGENGLPESISSALEELKTLLVKMIGQTRPDFFRIGFYTLHNPGETLAGQDVGALNERCLQYLDDHFMKEFISVQAKGVEHSYLEALEKKKALLADLAEAKTYFSGTFDKKGALDYAKKLSAQVDGTIDRLEVVKDPAAYTFVTSMVSGIEKYFSAKVNNPKEEARFARQTKRREALIARGKTVDWKVVPPTV